MHELQGRNTNSKTSLSEITSRQNKLLTDPPDIAESLNRYFSNIISKFAFPDVSHGSSSPFVDSVLDNYITDKIPENVYFTLPPIKEDFVMDFIKTLDTSKCTGLDGVSGKLLTKIQPT